MYNASCHQYDHCMHTVFRLNGVECHEGLVAIRAGQSAHQKVVWATQAPSMGD